MSAACKKPRPQRSDTARQPLSAALKLLARRAYSQAELYHALIRIFGPVEAVNEAISRLRSLGYLDDSKFAADYASMQIRTRGFGRERVRRELSSKGVAAAVIGSALDDAFNETEERELLDRALDKKIRSLQPPISRRKVSNLCQSMLRLGFRPDDIMKAVRARPELKAESVLPEIDC